MIQYGGGGTFFYRISKKGGGGVTFLSRFSKACDISITEKADNGTR